MRAFLAVAVGFEGSGRRNASFVERRRLCALLPAVLTLAACAGSDDGSDAADEAATAARTSGSTTQAAASFDRIPQIVREAEPSVVAVLVSAAAGEGEGSGVIWSEDGVVVTSHHVIQGAREITVVFASGRRVEARLRASDPLTDVAVLDVEAEGLPSARFASGLPVVGELAIAIGNPLGFENTVTAGIVSGLHRAIPSGGQTPALVDLLQTDAPISPGNSGGALVNARGEVIGINVAFIPPEARAVSIGFAIPSPTVVDVARELLEDGEVEHAFLGIQLSQLTPQIAERFRLEAGSGALVLDIAPGSPADRAGLEEGDVIVEFDDRRVDLVEDVLAALRKHEPGDRVELTVVRGGDRRTVAVVLGERPES